MNACFVVFFTAGERLETDECRCGTWLTDVDGGPGQVAFRSTHDRDALMRFAFKRLKAFPRATIEKFRAEVAAETKLEQEDRAEKERILQGKREKAAKERRDENEKRRSESGLGLATTTTAVAVAAGPARAGAGVAEVEAEAGSTSDEEKMTKRLKIKFSPVGTAKRVFVANSYYDFDDDPTRRRSGAAFPPGLG